MSSLIYSFIIYTVLSQFTPGPNNLMAMANASHHGVAGTRKFTIGVVLANIVFLSLCCIGQESLRRLIPELGSWMKWAACAYMVFLGVMIAKDAGKSGDSELPSFSINTVFKGFILQVINPKLILFCLTVAGGFLLPIANGREWVLVLLIIFMGASAYLANTMWAMFGAGIDRFLSKFRKVIDWGMVILVLLCAIEMATF